MREREEADRQYVLSQSSDDVQRQYPIASEVDDLNSHTEDRRTSTRFSGVLPDKYKSSVEPKTEVIVEATVL